jgi:hypothetical protein
MTTVPELQITSDAPGGLTCTAQADAETLTLALGGTADLSGEPLLAQLLERAHNYATALRAKAVRIDLTALKFMSSACFKDFVSWLAKVTALPAPARYRMIFKSNPTIRWQRGSLNALSCFAVDLVVLE